MKLLEIHASPRGEHSVSRTVAERLKTALTGAKSGFSSQIRDLNRSPLPHVSGELVQAFFTPPDSRSPEQTALLALSDQLCGELQAADTLVISTPMWNFSVPSVLKAWIDHIVRVGVTFRYGANGPEGLLNPDLEVFIVTASGGAYSNPETHMLDHTGPYLKQLFHFLGSKRIHLIPAESTALDAAQSLDNALERLTRLIAHHSATTHESHRGL